MPPPGARLTRSSDRPKPTAAADDCRMPLPVYTGHFGPARSREASLARGLRPATRREASRSPRRGLDGAVAHLLTHRPGQPGRARPPKVNGRRLFPLDKFGPRPPVVARPDGADEPAADGADDARLARLVRDVERDRRLAAADDPPEQHVPAVGARLVSRPRHAGDGEPRDAAVSQRAREREGRAERELRPRADGAVHARPRLRLHGARRARAGPRPDRVHRDVQERVRLGQVPLRPQPARRRDEGRLRQARPVRLEAGRDADHRRIPPTRRSSPASSGATSSRSPPTTRPRPRSRSSTSQSGYSTRSRPERDPQAPAALRGPPDGEASGRLSRGHAADPRRPHLDRGLRLAVDPGRAAALLPAQRLGLERRSLARHLDIPCPLEHRRAGLAEALVQP